MLPVLNLCRTKSCLADPACCATTFQFQTKTNLPVAMKCWPERCWPTGWSCDAALVCVADHVPWVRSGITQYIQGTLHWQRLDNRCDPHPAPARPR